MQDKRYQYKVETVKVGAFTSAAKADTIIQERMNRLSTEGWEFVELSTSYGSYPRLIMRK